MELGAFRVRRDKHGKVSNGFVLGELVLRNMNDSFLYMIYLLIIDKFERMRQNDKKPLSITDDW